MMYAKLVNGQIEYPVYRHGMLVDEENGIYIINPKKQHYLAAGFKVLVEEPIDIPEKKGYIIVPVYHEEGENIIQEWTYKKQSGGSTSSDTDTDEEA